MSDIVGVSNSRKPKGPHGLYRDNFSFIPRDLSELMTANWEIGWNNIESTSLMWQNNSYSVHTCFVTAAKSRLKAHFLLYYLIWGSVTFNNKFKLDYGQLLFI
jgi:hypothetical protein